MFFLMLNLIIKLYKASSTSRSQPSSSLFMDPVIWQVLFCVFYCFSLMIMNLTYLFLINAQMRRQRGTLSLLILSKYRYINQLETYFHLSSSSGPPASTSLSDPMPPLDKIPALIAEQHDLIASLDGLLTVYENIDELKGSKIAGFKIERQHIIWIITTLSLFLYSLYVVPRTSVQATVLVSKKWRAAKVLLGWRLASLCVPQRGYPTPGERSLRNENTTAAEEKLRQVEREEEGPTG